MNNLITSFLPHSSWVSDSTYREMQVAPISHRSKEFQLLYEEIQHLWKEIFPQASPCFLFSSSTRGALEGFTKNLTQKKILHLSNGSFGEKWIEISRKQGIPHSIESFDWKEKMDLEKVEKKILEEDFDVIAFVHSETSTGILNPMKALSVISKKYNKLLLVDAASSLGAVPITDDFDLLVSTSAKAFALPPGMSICSFSEKAIDYCSSRENLGFYYHPLEIKKAHQKNQTLCTPPTQMFYALRYQLRNILKEGGLQKRAERYLNNQKILLEWAKKKGFSSYPPEEALSPSLVVLETRNFFHSGDFTQALYEETGFQIDAGYGDLQGKTLRISTMGEISQRDIENLIVALEKVLPKFL